MSKSANSSGHPSHGGTAEDRALASTYIEIARLQTSDELEIDDEPAVSIVDDNGEGNGAWVAAWVWVGEYELAPRERS
jgi:hypothetical protein